MARNASIRKCALPATLAILIAILAPSRLTAGPGTGAPPQLLKFGQKGEVEITVFCPFEHMPAKGYLPLDVQVKNKTDVPIELSLRGTGINSFWRGQFRFNSNFRVDVEKSSTQTSSFLLPLPTQFDWSSGYSSNADLEIRVAGMGSRSANYYSSGSRREILHCPKSGNAVPSIGSSVDKTGFDPDRAPVDWRAYSAFEVIVCRESSWRSLSPPAQRAIGDWVRLGGRLVLWEKENAPRLSPPVLATLDRDGGLGRVFAAAAPNDGVAQALVRQAWNYSPNTVTSFSTDYDPSIWGLLESMGVRQFGTTLVVLVLIVFGILVGPVNLFYLAKAGRRHLLFFTTPAISLVTSLLLAAIILLQDGFGGSGKRFVLVHSDPAGKKLFLVQEQAARTGVVLGREFEPSDPAWISHVSLSDSRWTFVHDGSGNDVTLTLNGRSFTGDWFRSRSEQAHFAKSVVQSRERLELVDPAPDPDGSAGPTLLSTFRASLGPVFYIGANDSVWFAKELQSGQPVRLTRSDQKSARDFWINYSAAASDLLSAPIDRILGQGKPGEFFAYAEGADVPQIDAGPMRWDSAALIHGRVLDQAASPPLTGPSPAP